jgi:hypothetical protein
MFTLFSIDSIDRPPRKKRWEIIIEKEKNKDKEKITVKAFVSLHKYK